MLDATALRWGSLPSLVQRSLAALAMVLFLALVYFVLAGTPHPMAPASSLFAPVSVQTVLADSRPALSSADFSLRPVFAIKRVPPAPQQVSEEAEKASAEVAPNDEIMDGIDEISLLGIFGSREVAGAIVRLDNGERHRLPVGESVKGWTLRALEPRGALFEATTGQRALLRMAFSTNQSAEALPAPAVPPAQSAASEQPVGSSSDSAAMDAETPPKTMTFGDVHRGRSTANESGEK
ncbi:MAG: hypothetical protein HOK02_07475 [Halieaceae bacterium]|nr:hypothetical protein [Halieaceae bacterium]